MKIVIFGLAVSSSWGNGHATLWRGLCRSLGRMGHRVVFFERDVPYYASHRDLFELPGGRLCLYPDWVSVLPAARLELADADVAIVTSFCPDAIAASDLALSSPLSLRVFYDLDTPVTLRRLENGESVSYIGPRGLADFDLVLSYTGGRALAELRDKLGARRAAPLRQRGPLRSLPGAGVPNLCGRPFLPRHVCGRPRRGAEDSVCRTGAPSARSTVRDRRVDVRCLVSLAAQYLLCQPRAAGRSSRILLFLAAHVQCHARRHGGDGVLPVRPLV